VTRRSDLRHRSARELRTEAAPEAAECPDCAKAREVECLGPLWLPVPTGKERKQHRRGRLDDPWWEVRLLHERFCPSWKRWP
jgi:hypothetical protein